MKSAEYAVSPWFISKFDPILEARRNGPERQAKLTQMLLEKVRTKAFSLLKQQPLIFHGARVDDGGTAFKNRSESNKDTVAVFMSSLSEERPPRHVTRLLPVGALSKYQV